MEHAHALRTVLRVAEAVHIATDLRDLGARTVDAVVQYAGFAAVALYRVHAEVDRAELIAARGFAPETVRVGSTLPLSQSLTGIAVRTRTITTASSFADDARLDAPTRLALNREGFSDAACVPVCFGDTPIGCLALVYKRAPQLTGGEQEMLTGIARSIGVAMQQRISADRERAAEARLRHAQQLESLGLLAGGIAHDFNNLLTGVLGNLSLARSVQPAERELLLSEAERAAERASALARQLSRFARGSAPLKRPTRAVEEIVRDAAAFALRGRDNPCEFVGAPIGPGLVDPDQLGQVVHNLVLNAAQASPQGAPVSVTLSAFDDAGARWMRLTVRDRGPGIAPEHRAKIFEPYFTTREAGTGLGLAVTHAIVHRHGGRIDLESAPGLGTAFHVLVPCEPAEARATPTPPPPTALPTRVLVVDDEPQIRLLARNLLQHLGVEVLEARSSDEAEAVFERAVGAGQPVDGVILDMTLVGSEDGSVTLARLRALDPQLKAVVSSGYTDDDTLNEYRSYGFDAALPKPYTLPQMARALSVLRRA
jgi:two-component system, cell cycle sensor histidine kinase and response regulator CckA